MHDKKNPCLPSIVWNTRAGVGGGGVKGGLQMYVKINISEVCQGQKLVNWLDLLDHEFRLVSDESVLFVDQVEPLLH